MSVQWLQKRRPSMLPTRQNIFDHAKDLLCRSIQDDKKPSVSPETKFLIQKIADNKKKLYHTLD